MFSCIFYNNNKEYKFDIIKYLLFKNYQIFKMLKKYKIYF